MVSLGAIAFPLTLLLIVLALRFLGFLSNSELAVMFLLRIINLAYALRKTLERA